LNQAQNPTKYQFVPVHTYQILLWLGMFNVAYDKEQSQMVSISEDEGSKL
jgi:hypothetical protein